MIDAPLCDGREPDWPGGVRCILLSDHRSKHMPSEGGAQPFPVVYMAQEPCCDYRDHAILSPDAAYGFCTCTEHPQSELHPFGWTVTERHDD